MSRVERLKLNRAGITGERSVSYRRGNYAQAGVGQILSSRSIGHSGRSECWQLAVAGGDYWGRNDPPKHRKRPSPLLGRDSTAAVLRRLRCGTSVLERRNNSRAIAKEIAGLESRTSANDLPNQLHVPRVDNQSPFRMYND